ncbi:MAG: hypothetical protein ACXVHR_00135 [Methanobacterium sp.]
MFVSFSWCFMSGSGVGLFVWIGLSFYYPFIHTAFYLYGPILLGTILASYISFRGFNPE